MTELLERWLASVELHASYLDLDAAAYATMQEWPRHQRPTRWVVELARTRILDLRRLLAERQAQGDQRFAEALELMGFLTNLLGSEHVERFIPLAQPRTDTQPVAPPVASGAAQPAAAPRPARRADPRTRPVARANRGATAQAARARQPPASHAPVVRPADPPVHVDSKAIATVIADAARLISWGREWPQLAGLIARLADRPPEAEIWKILRRHRADIEAQARRPRD